MGNFDWIHKKLPHYIGFYSFYITFYVGVFLLVYPKLRANLLSYYVIFYLISSILVKILKPIIKQPRPANPNNTIISESLDNEEKYGMPSGHATAVFYCISFLYWAEFLTPELLWLFAFIACFMYYQRWINNRHTIQQLFAGSCFGFAFGWLAVYLSKKWRFEFMNDSNFINLPIFGEKDETVGFDKIDMKTMSVDI